MKVKLKNSPMESFNLGGLSEENWIRIQEQNEKPISVIIGNPPYNDQQSNWYEQNPNRQYTEVDRRIRDTYIKEGTAQRTHQYDMCKRFLRWASDRLADDGIIGFVSNSAFLDTRQDDGFRKALRRTRMLTPRPLHRRRRGGGGLRWPARTGTRRGPRARHHYAGSRVVRFRRSDCRT